MEERRRNKRLDLKAALRIKRLDNGRTEEIAIEISDISKTGIGFTCNESLELDSLFDASITIWTKEVISCLVEIVRKVEREDTFCYGAIFIGMTECTANRIEFYDLINQFGT